MTQAPKNITGLLWSKKPQNISLKRDKNYIVNQVLALGNLKALKWLFKTYSKAQVKEVFLKSPSKMYTPQAFNFIKRFILKINKNLNPSKYVKNIF